MRSEREILDLILNIARADDRIRAAILNGSRANPNAPRDFFQDFDMVYFVTEMEPFVRNLDWIEQFGERMILQTPEDMGDHPPSLDEGYAYLMQFADGNRIDLGVYPLAKIPEKLQDSLSLPLLDKDGLLPPIPPASEAGYLPTPPIAHAFADCCNEFWWLAPYVAKGLWRGEILYAKHMLDHYQRDQLMKLLRWHIGLHTGFAANPGKLSKYFQRYLEPELWDLLLQTYADAGYTNTWEALFAMCALFRQVAVPLAEQYGFEYPFDDDRRVFAHLQHVRSLPRDAQTMY